MFIFSVGLNSKESACDVGDLSSIPGSRSSPKEGNGYPLWYSHLENSMEEPGRLQSWGCKKSNATERLTLSYVQRRSDIGKERKKRRSQPQAGSQSFCFQPHSVSQENQIITPEVQRARIYSFCWDGYTLSHNANGIGKYDLSHRSKI